MLGSLLERLQARADAGRPLRMALVGAGTFGTMVLAQAARIRGLEVAGVADLSPDRAARALERAGLAGAGVPVTDDAPALIGADGVEVVVEATGAPAAGIAHALEAIRLGRHVVMVNVEADVLAGPALAARARAAGVSYGLAYGDQPALIAELVDWARASGFEVVAAGKGTKYLPHYHQATPETVWEHYGLTPERVAAGGFNAQMFTSFLDGTKSAIEMAAVCNSCGLWPQEEGLGFPPCPASRLAEVCSPRPHGTLSRAGTVEVVSSLERGGSPIDGDLRWGVWVTYAAGSDFVAGMLGDYGLPLGGGGRVSAMYRPYHLIGLETPVSVLAAGLLGQPTGSPTGLRAEVECVAKRDLAAGEELDGEGGFTVWGRLAPAARAREAGSLPIGLAHGVRLARPVAAGEVVRIADLVEPPAGPAVELREEAPALTPPS